jgi:glycosyltransferase involved in cell wall biosynthesis
MVSQDARDFEVIYVDDGSTDETPILLDEYAQAHPDLIRFTRIEASGPGTARNEGVKLAKGRLLLFTEDDTFPAGDWVGKMAAYRAMHGYEAMSGGFTSFTAATPAEKFAEYQHKINYGGGVRAIEHVGMINFIVTKVAFAKTGGFRGDGSPALVDADFCDKLRAQGVRILYEPDIRIRHHAPCEWESVFDKLLALEAASVYLRKERGERAATRFPLDVLRFAVRVLLNVRRYPLEMYSASVRYAWRELNIRRGTRR